MQTLDSTDSREMVIEEEIQLKRVGKERQVNAARKTMQANQTGTLVNLLDLVF